ncbi:maleylacetoacetate isomerase [uncultured Tateyamaria sp.]|uniref:maleylacetoacetate isomerase n=1 Tax=uncultured Tateyamaria sp. TaxID=455651 RepID=UPI002634973D|nr:maleylacetoacetate isomerase [uncultured Tateyamaria sp.]
MKLYSYWRTTTSYRVRIALGMNGLKADIIPIELVAGAQTVANYATLNPIKGALTLVTDAGDVLTQSTAILDYLDQIASEPPLLPTGDPVQRARVLAAAMAFATDVHPVNNLKVVGRLKSLAGDDTGIPWMRHCMTEGFTAFAALIEAETPFCFGDTPMLADICLVAQLCNSHRWGVDLTPFARLTEIEARRLALPAFATGRPENQKDAS